MKKPNFLPLSLLILGLYLGACAKSSQTETTMNVTVAKISQLSTLQGGIFLMLVDSKGARKYYDLPANNQVALPSGTHDLHFVAYQGPNQWSGPQYCASLPQTKIAGAELVLNVSLSGSACLGNSLYSQMDQIKNPQARWDVAMWDRGKWSP